MKLRLFSILAALSLLLLVASLVLWVRSYRTKDVLLFRQATTNGQAEAGHDRQVMSAHGYLVLMTADWSHGVVPSGQPTPRGPVATNGWPRSPDAGFRWIRIDADGDINPALYPKYPTRLHSGGLRRISYGTLALCLAVLPAIWLGGRIWKSVQTAPGRCPSCGYDLRASPERCPECGQIPAP